MTDEPVEPPIPAIWVTEFGATDTVLYQASWEAPCGCLIEAEYVGRRDLRLRACPSLNPDVGYSVVWRDLDINRAICADRCRCQKAS